MALIGFGIIIEYIGLIAGLIIAIWFSTTIGFKIILTSVGLFVLTMIGAKTIALCKITRRSEK